MPLPRKQILERAAHLKGRGINALLKAPRGSLTEDQVRKIVDHFGPEKAKQLGFVAPRPAAVQQFEFDFQKVVPTAGLPKRSTPDPLAWMRKQDPARVQAEQERLRRMGLD